MSALSEALNRANVHDWSSREIARRMGDRISYATVANYLRGKHAARPSDDVLQAFAEVFPGLTLPELRRLAGSPMGEGAPYEPPAEANRLTGRQRRAVDEIIRAIVQAEPLVMSPEEHEEWLELRRSGEEVSAQEWLEQRRAHFDEHKEWLEGGGWRIGVEDDQIVAEAALLGMSINDYVNGFPDTWMTYKSLRDDEVTKYVNELVAVRGGDLRGAMEENSLRMIESDLDPTLFAAANQQLTFLLFGDERRLRVVREAQPVEQAADHEAD